VAYSDNGQPLGAVALDANGQAMLTTSTLGAGSHPIVAAYIDGDNYLASSATVTQAVHPAISIDDVTVREPERRATTAPAAFAVHLSNPSPQTVLVHFATADGTARAGTDYVATRDTLVFAPGETMQTITVDVIGNPRRERTETFLVNLSAATNATIADGEGIGSIVDRREPELAVTTVAPPMGTPGASVVIVGKGFGGVTSVTFNGVAAAFSLISPNVIRAIVPATATTGRVTVSTATETATSAAEFTVNAPKPRR
jgi:hypothetical protein